MPVWHPSSLQQDLDVWSQESLSLLAGLVGPPQTRTDLGLAAWASEDYCGLRPTESWPAIFTKANFSKSMLPNQKKGPHRGL